MSHLRWRLAAAAAAAAVCALLAGVGTAWASPSGIVVSQVYGGGGNAGATLTHDFVELYNAGSTTVSLSGWSVQYAPAAGTSWQTTALSGSIAPGRYYLVQQAQGAGGTTPLPAPDAAGTIAMSATAGKVALVQSTTALTGSCPTGSEDFVGFGATANCFEGTGPTPAPSNTNAVLRANGGCVDTNDNAADFAAGSPTPRNGGSPAHTCDVDLAPAVASTSPADGAVGVATGAGITITFSEPVTLTDPWFTIQCALSGGHAATVSGGPTAWTLQPLVPFAAEENCTVTIAAASVMDVDTNDPPDAMAANHAFSFTTAAPPPPPGSVVISEVYGGGGNSGATYTHDFIELYNRTAAPVSLAGWSVQYASATGPAWQVTPLTGSIQPGRNYLVQQAAGAGGTVGLPAPDATGTIAMAAGAGKVALVAGTAPLTGTCPASAAIADLVGYGGASCFETAPTPALSNTTSAQRRDGGAQDTDDNSADFTVGVPEPRSSADLAPTVVSTRPAAGATGVGRNGNVRITFSEAVDVTGAWFTIVCASTGVHTAAVAGGPITFVLDPHTSFAPDEECTVTVVGANVSDQDTEDPPDTMAADHVFEFRTAEILPCGDPATFIHQVQGSGALSPLVGNTVSIEGVVVGDYQATTTGLSGFYLQEEASDADGDAATSEGVFVFDDGYGTEVEPGDVVRVRGAVVEFFNLTELTSVSGLEVCASGESVAPTAVSLPVLTSDAFERFEGMLVRLDQTLTATEVFTLGRFGEVSLSSDGRLFTPTAVASPGDPALAVAAQNALRRIVLDDGSSEQNPAFVRYPFGGLSALNTLRVGDTLPGLTGVMDFRFSSYRIQPVGSVDFARTNPRTPEPEPVGGDLKVASFNVLNLFNGDGLGGGFPTSRGATTPEELERQLAKIVSALAAIDADVVGLMEIENDAGPNTALAQLVDALNAELGSGTYAYVDTGVVGTDEIKVALIYKPASASPVGDWKVIDSAVDPRFVDDRNRPSLAQTFEQTGTGERLTVLVNHLKSKGSPCPRRDGRDEPDDPDTGDGQGNCNLTRTRAAAAIVDWLATDPTGSGDPDFLVIGDLNAYTFEDPIGAFEDGGYRNLVRAFGGLSAYSYVFNGESGYLDHALATPSLDEQATRATDWHINPDEPIALDYNLEFKSEEQQTTYYDPGPYRASDHDPVVVGLMLDVTFDKLCELTRLYSANGGVANALCAKLAVAEAGASRGRGRPDLRSYVNQVRDQDGEAFTSDEAARLIRFAGSL